MKWTLIAKTSKTFIDTSKWYVIENVQTGLCLSYNTSNHKIVPKGCNGRQNALFKFSPNGVGSYSVFTYSNSSRALAYNEDVNTLKARNYSQGDANFQFQVIAFSESSLLLYHKGTGKCVKQKDDFHSKGECNDGNSEKAFIIRKSAEVWEQVFPGGEKCGS